MFLVIFQYTYEVPAEPLGLLFVVGWSVISSINRESVGKILHPCLTPLLSPNSLVFVKYSTFYFCLTFFKDWKVDTKFERTDARNSKETYRNNTVIYEPVEQMKREENKEEKVTWKGKQNEYIVVNNLLWNGFKIREV